MGLHHFLIVYHVRDGKLLEQVDLGENGDDAVAAYAAYEERYRGQDGIEIVLVGADSIETIRRTHAHYFRSEGDTAEFWRTVVPS